MIEALEAVTTESCLDQPLSTVQAGEVVIGTLRFIDDEGRPHVSYPGFRPEESVVSLTSQPLTCQQIGRQVALVFINGDLRKPMIIGLVHSPLEALLENYNNLSDPDPAAHDARCDRDVRSDAETAYIDGDRVLIKGKREVVLKCGEASITLTRAGKVIIRGKYILSRSSGAHRIQGCSVQVN